MGSVFIYASWDKIIAPEAFAQAIANYQILPTMLINPTALLLPWLELVCGLCLIFNRWIGGSALIVTVMMGIFMGALGYNAYRGMDVSCGCFTLDEVAPKNMWFYLARDAVLLAMAIGLMFGRRTNSPDIKPS